ncbi:MAG: hypothetical protein M3Q36_04335 [bacterium]|nr:hypothetical protein [bacterium]
MDAMQVSKDGRLSRVLDTVAVLIIGITVGIASIQLITWQETKTVQPIKIIRRTPATNSLPGEGTVDAPKYPEGLEIEEG